MDLYAAAALGVCIPLGGCILGFSQIHVQIGIIAVYVCSFLLYLYYMLLVYVKLE